MDSLELFLVRTRRSNVLAKLAYGVLVYWLDSLAFNGVWWQVPGHVVLANDVENIRPGYVLRMYLSLTTVVISYQLFRVQVDNTLCLVYRRQSTRACVSSIR